MEAHDDAKLISDLNTSLKEGDTILASLKDKAMFSHRLEKERAKMITDRASLLSDLCSQEKLTYKKNLKTLPPFIEVPHQKGKPLDSVTSKIRHKIFKDNGKMRKRSPEIYSRRESAIKLKLRFDSDKKNRLSSMTRVTSCKRKSKKKDKSGNSFLNTSGLLLK